MTKDIKYPEEIRAEHQERVVLTVHPDIKRLADQYGADNVLRAAAQILRRELRGDPRVAQKLRAAKRWMVEPPNAANHRRA
jgi:GGDEF domain-containing protein